MIRNYFRLYDILTKELYLSEDKAKEFIIAIYESAGEQMKKQHLGVEAVMNEE